MVVLGLGSNCGDRLGYLREAIHKIQHELSPGSGIKVSSISPLYESDALLPPGAPKGWDQPFLNINILCTTDLNPSDLLTFVKSVETKIGRKNRGRWAPREIDIDILTMGNLVYTSSTLQIPHAGLLERPFAFLPLTDLAPNWIISIPGKHFGTSAEAYSNLWKQDWETVPFRTRRSSLNFTELMGVLNITPDSFSDGGLHNQIGFGIQQIKNLIQDGIRIIDIGGESTRPGANLLETEEEWGRIAPFLREIQTARNNSIENSSPEQRLIQLPDVRFSIDTRNPTVAARSIVLGADWINDVSGFKSNEMKEVISGTLSSTGKPVKIVMMHSLSVPPTKTEVLSPYEDPVNQLIDWAETRMKDLGKFGIERDRIIFDPGLGFGKTPQQSWEILRRAHEFHKLGVPILFGHSRKSFLTTLTSKSPQDRDLETTLISVELAKKGISYLRVHNGEQNKRGLKVWSEIDGVCRW